MRQESGAAGGNIRLSIKDDDIAFYRALPVAIPLCLGLWGVILWFLIR